MKSSERTGFAQNMQKLEDSSPMRKNEVVRHASPIAVALLLALAGGCGSSKGGWPAAGAAMIAPRAVQEGGQAMSVAEGAVGFPQYPALSPDGALVTYAWAGDLWIVPTSGGISIQLTTHPADDRRSAFSPDGKWLAFDSTRDGGRNLYVAPISRNGGVLSIGQPVRITTADQVHNLGGWTADGKGLLFSASREPAMYRSARMYRVGVRMEGERVVGGGVIEPLTEAFGQLPRAAADGSGVVFMRNSAGLERPKYRGSGNTDVYRMNADGTFARLTDFEGTDAEGSPLPDGSVVFISSRDGQNNVWRLARGQSTPLQLTRFAPKAGEATIAHGVRDLSVSADGKTAAFCVWDTLYTLDLSGGGGGGAEPKVVSLRSGADSVVPDTVRMSLDREVTEQAISPDGKTIAMVARGEVFVRSTQEGFPTRRVTMTSGRERGVAWSPDGKVLYFASDDAGEARTGEAREGVYSIYKASVELAREDISPEKEKKAKEDRSKEEKPKEEKKPEAAGEPAAEAKPAEGAAEATKDKKEEPKKPEKKPDFGKRWAEALRFKVEQVLTLGAADARNPNPSPDGTKLLFTRGRGDLMMLDLASSAQTELLSSWDDPDAIWAGDSRHVIYAVSDLDFNSDIWLLDTGSPRGAPGEGAKRRWANPVNLTQHPDNDVSPRLSADGKVLAFLSERAAENDELDVWVVNLDRAIDSMSGYDRDEYFKKAAEAAGKRKPLGASGDKPEGEKKGDDKKPDDKKPEEKKDDKKPEADKPAEPMEFDAEDAYLRVRRLVSMPGAETSLAMTPGGDRVIFVGSSDPERALMSVDFKGGDKKVLQAGAVGDVKVTLTGDKVSFVRTGQAFATNPKSGGKVDGYPIDAPVVVNIPAQQRQKFLEASRALGEGFYHPTLKGLDWPALTERYLSLIMRTRTNDEFNRITQMLFGELDGSHTGISGGSSFFPAAAAPAVGYLGVRTAPVPGGYRVESVTMGSPADAKGVRLEKGDVLVAVDGVRFAPNEAAMPMIELEAAMAGKAGKETLVEVKRVGVGDGTASKPAMFLTTPIGYTAWVDLGYWDEVGRRREAVEKLSGGKVGYLHIRAMGEAAVRDFERDLYAAAHGKSALIIDVRDNGGGSTADILLSSLTAPAHAYTIPRGADPKTVPTDSYPRDRRLIYGYSKPIVVLINQNAFSNAEIFAHAIKTIKRGKLVGTATFGGVISTGAISLIDGTTVRMPFRGWYLPDGTDQENHGAQPDIDVPQTPEDEAAGRDRQLEAAVKELMK